MKTLFAVFAITAATPAWAEAPKSAPGGMTMLIPWIAILGIFYFLLIRPQQKERQKHQTMLDALKRGDQVLTQGGLYGTVQALKGKTVELKISDDVKVLVNRGYIAQVVQGDPAAVEPEVVANGAAR